MYGCDGYGDSVDGSYSKKEGTSLIPFCILAIENDDDREFMAELFLRYQRLLYNEIYEILNNPWNTEDILQATLVKLIDKIPELRKKEETKLVSYMVVAARNNTYNFLRAQKKSAQVSFEEYSGQENSASADRQIESGMIAKEEIEEMVRRWSQLDERSKRLLEGKYILGKSDEALAGELSINPASVRMALTRARQNAYQIFTK